MIHTERLPQGTGELRRRQHATGIVIAHGQPDLVGLLVVRPLAIPDRGFYSFPYSYKPAHAARTHVKNENFNPDYFIRLKDSHDVLVVEIKEEGDDSNRNRAKYRDGLKHFKTLNAKLEEMGESWRYHFKFLSPEDYTLFFGCITPGSYPEWKSSLMLELERG
jgi:type III restriction enzyme